MTLAVLAACFSTWLLPWAALADPPHYVKKCSPITRKCITVLSSTIPVPGGTTEETTKPVKKVSTKPVCNFGGAAQACTSELGNWSNTHQCYLQRMSPPPPYDSPIWTGKDLTKGSVWACVREQGYDEGRHLVTRFVWIQGEPDIEVVDPLTLVYRAIAEMKLGKPQVGTAPGPAQIGLVNMPVWLWVTKSENTWGPITRSANVPGLTVNVKAQVKAVNWSLGDGKTLRCETAGTPYNKSSGLKDSPDCGHRYVKTSHNQPNCKYNLTATTEWDITWESTLGDNGQIPMTQSAGTQLRIGEAVPVLVDPDSNAQALAAPNTADC
ncbi:hypothetical protein [Kribbella italica]|uniref:ATP/GTP-binding protein n=1 Tax=Kribbella italica TaxID=1540520 RepID=A0A7W9MRL1_9ACTN|nr:hypothetical protein [Kribbella italica]MBB5833746.1 hypothetical protein [Kribbella italica]